MMKIYAPSPTNYQSTFTTRSGLPAQTNLAPKESETNKNNVSFKGLNFLSDISGYYKYIKAQKYADALYNYVIQNEGTDKFLLRNYIIDPLEGIQYNIKAFKNLTIKEIQYLSENLHVIAVKRGCKNMCAHCYANAKPSNRQMSYEDFHTITDGFKTLRKRMHGLDIYAENTSVAQEVPIYRTTELFYDADCMDIILKDKKGKEYDFIELAEELYDSLGRKTVFDTSGWYRNNPKYQQRAEKYAQHFSDDKNLEKLEAFNVSFNVFNASYIASLKAAKANDLPKAKRLRERFVNNMANTLFTFTPVAHNPKFQVLVRAFHHEDKMSNGFNDLNMMQLIEETLTALNNLYKQDLYGEQKYVKTPQDYEKYMELYTQKLCTIDTALNSSGRMQKFIQEHNIKTNRLQDHSKTTPVIIDSLKDNARLSKILMQRLIDTDGKIYHMDYARFFPTELQLNIEGKNTPAPKLANLIEDFVITKKNINQ